MFTTIIHLINEKTVTIKKYSRAEIEHGMIEFYFGNEERSRYSLIVSNILYMEHFEYKETE